MKVERVSKHIWGLESWFLIPVRVWVVSGDDGLTLVDTGFPFMGRSILKFVRELQQGPLKRVLLTHGHSDHVGALKQILQSESVPVYAHRLEIPYMEGALPYPGRRWKERNVAPGVAQPLPDAGFAGLRPCLAPGHSPGHVAYHHEQDRVLLGGDLFTARNGQLRRPMAMFTADMAQALRSGEILRQLQPERLEVCHGGAVLNPADQLEQLIRAAS